MIDPDNGVPVYRQVADDIRGQIERGEVASGRRLRTEPEYEHIYGVGRATVRRAMEILRQEGLIVTTRHGSRVRTLPDMAEVDAGADARIATRMPTAEERRRLGVAAGVPVFVVERPGREPEIYAGDRTVLVT